MNYLKQLAMKWIIKGYVNSAKQINDKTIIGKPIDTYTHGLSKHEINGMEYQLQVVLTRDRQRWTGEGED